MSEAELAVEPEAAGRPGREIRVKAGRIVAGPVDEDTNPLTEVVDEEEELRRLVRRVLEIIGEEPDREGLRRTPERVAKALRWLTSGYARHASDAVGDGIFAEAHTSMVLVRDIEFYSLCEHHMLPFFGRVHIAYIPNGRIIGLSKLARVVDVVARRLQVQERLTDEVADSLWRVLRPAGVAVAVESAHLCMMMRGVEKQGSKTVTLAMRGTFAECATRRGEFMRLALREG